MIEDWAEQLEAWHDFYVIVGSGAAALTGVMFIVASLRTQAMAERQQESVRAFVTPTVVFFSTVLVVAGLVTIPTMSRPALAGILALGGLGALGYMLSVRGHRQWRTGRLDREDWLFYIGLPLLSYCVILAAAAAIWMEALRGLEILGAAMILLLVVGIRNAWDLVLWMTQHRTDH